MTQVPASDVPFLAGTTTRRSIDVYAAALAGTPVRLRHASGEWQQLDCARWLGPARRADLTILDRLHGPVLDVGCGPGRFVVALAQRGVPALGVDIAPEAVRLTRNAGGIALQRCVFRRLPGEGRWQTVLIADGNIGIGGDPVRLLRRAAALLGPTGRVLVEVDGAGQRRGAVRLERQDEIGDWFAWAQVGADVARGLVEAHGGSISMQNSGPGCCAQVVLPGSAQPVPRASVLTG